MTEQSESTQEPGTLVAHYLDKIQKITKGAGYAYRGQADVHTDWRLESGAARRIRSAISTAKATYSEPSKQNSTQPITSARKKDEGWLLPHNMVDYHRNLLDEARHKGFGLPDGRELWDLELLTQLQHFGAATCLLDFTESALVALYFACRGNDGKGGEIFCVPHRNISSAPKDAEISALLQEKKLYQWRPVMHGEAERRIIRQDGLFLINLPSNLDDWEKITVAEDNSEADTLSRTPADLKKIIITIQAANKEKIREELKNAYQISEETLFIDLSGFSQNQASGRKLERYWALLYSGNEKVYQGQSEAAIADYDAAICLKPDLAAAYTNHGLANYNLGRFEAAIADFDEAIRLNPDLVKAYNNRGISQARLGQHEAAIADFDEAIRLKSDDAMAYYNRGLAKENLGQYEAAIADFDEAIRFKPDYAEAYTNRGNAKANLGYHKAAIADYNEAIHLKPDDSDAYNNRGVARGDLGQYEVAITDYDEAIRLQPDMAEAYNNRGVAKKSLGQLEAAIADHDEAIRLKPDLADAYNNRGVAKGHLGQPEAAIEDYDEAIRLKPDLADAYSNRGNMKAFLKKPEAAIADYDEAVRLKPDLAETYNNRGNVKTFLGQYEAAIEDYDKVIRLKPDNAWTYYHRGDTWIKLGNRKQAGADLQKASILAVEQNLPALGRLIRKLLHMLGVSGD